MGVAMLNKVSLPKVPPTPLVSTPPPLFCGQLCTAMPVMHGAFTSSRTLSGLVAHNTFLMPCCMQTTLPDA